MTTEEAIATVTIDLTAQEFLAELAREVPWDERLVGCWFEGDPNEGNQHKWRPRPITSTTRIPLDQNTYVTVSAFRRAVTPEGDDAGFRRKTEFFARGVALMVDDIGTKAPADIPRRVPPTALIETSPGNFQAWYFLSPAEADKERFDYAIRAFISARLLGQDPGMAGVNRVGRLPDGINGKAKYAKDGQPFAQRVHVWEPSRRYTPEQIAQAHGFDLAASQPRTPRRKPSDSKPAGSGYLPILEAAGLYLEPIRGFHGGHRIVCPWHESHTSKDTTGTAYFEPDEQNDGRGGFKCQHGHCSHRTIADLDWFVVRLLAGRGAA